MLVRLRNVQFVCATVLLAAAVTACEDPAASVPAASVGSAKPGATATAKVTTTATAAATSATATSAATATASAALPAAPTKPADALELGPGSSKIGWAGSKVTGKHEGTFEKFSGWIALTDDKPENAKIYLEIDMDSVKSDSEKLDGHLKADDFFGVAKHPKATFVSTGIKAGGEGAATHTITGNLTMRGVEKSVSFPATIKLAADKVTAKSEFSINRKDWGIVYEGKKDDLIRDNVAIKLDLTVPRAKK